MTTRRLIASLALSVLALALLTLLLAPAPQAAHAALDWSASARPQAILLNDNFDYGVTPGNLTSVSGGNWVAHSGIGSVPVQYITTGLSMSGYGSSGVGGSATISTAVSTASAEDVNRSFITQTSGTVYFAALVNVSAATGTGDYFLHFKDATTGFRARVFVKDAAGALNFGLSMTGTTGTYSTAVFTYNTTYLVVAKYNVSTGDSTLYVLDTFSATEPPTPLVSLTGTGSLAVQAVAIRQGATNQRPAATIDGVRVANTWAEVVGYAAPQEADLSILKSGPATASAGDTITYTIDLSNTGTATATTTLVTDTLPLGVDFVTYTTALPVNFSQPDASTLVWDLGDVAPGASDLLIEVQGTVSSSVIGGTVLTNTAEATTAFTETNLANNASSATTLIGAPDLVVIKDGPASVNAGDLVTYTLTYSNTGDLAATGVVLVDQLPAAMSYVADSLGTGVQVGNSITWTLGSLPVNATGSIVLTATAITVGDYANVATISSSSADSDPLNNISVVTTTILGSDPFVTKTGPAAVFGGERITYTVVYGNLGSTPVDVTLTDTLPISFTTADIAYDDSGLNPIDDTNTRTWTATLASGTRFTYTLALTVPTSIASNTRITNTIAITGTGLGNNPINDLASASSTVYQIVPIAAARAGTNGQVFAIEGSVIYVPGTLGTNEWGVQDASGGISVFFSPAPVAALGDRVRLVATRGAFSGQAQLAAPVYFFANLGSGPQVTPKPYTTGQVAAGASEGWLIVITGTVSSLSACPTTANYQFNLDDGSGATTIFVDKDTAVNVCALGVVNGDPLMITGFSTQFNGVFEVKPRFPADVIRYPRVLSVNPINNATGVTITTAITAAFNMTMTNVTSTTFTLQGPGGAVDGNVAYDVATKIATFTPLTNLAFGTRYTATLKSTLLADNGLTLFPAQDYVWNFTTHQTTPNLSTSTKANSVNGAVRSGEWVTYTITLNNTGDGNATAVVTDVLGSYYSVAKLLDFTQPTTGTLTWTGVVTAGQSVSVRFVAQVKAPQYLPIGPSLLFNSAEVNDGVHAPSSLDDSTPPTITIYGLYLPLIRR